MLNRKTTSRKLYLDRNSKASVHLTKHPEDATWLERVANTPQAIWLTSKDALPRFRASVDAAQDKDELVVAILYFVPDRDFRGGFSAGGARTDQDYEMFVDAICDAIADRQVIVVVEPDAVPDIFDADFGDSRAARRTMLLKYACSRLASLKHADVYLDCGHAYWPSEGKLKQWLRAHQLLNQITGIALNVSNYNSTQACLDRARAVFELEQDAVVPVIVDCSRNGAPLPPWYKDEDAWCNPIGARLGPDPFLAPLHFHGQLWIKRPGESDGIHNGGPAAGEFCRELCRRLCSSEWP